MKARGAAGYLLADTNNQSILRIDRLLKRL